MDERDVMRTQLRLAILAIVVAITFGLNHYFSKFEGLSMLKIMSKVFLFTIIPFFIIYLILIAWTHGYSEDIKKATFHGITYNLTILLMMSIVFYTVMLFGLELGFGLLENTNVNNTFISGMYYIFFFIILFTPIVKLGKKFGLYGEMLYECFKKSKLFGKK